MEEFKRMNFEYTDGVRKRWDFYVDERQPEVFTRRVITEKSLHTPILTPIIPLATAEAMITEQDILSCGI